MYNPHAFLLPQCITVLSVLVRANNYFTIARMRTTNQTLSSFTQLGRKTGISGDGYRIASQLKKKTMLLPLVDIRYQNLG